jgi:hypothetical protein
MKPNCTIPFEEGKWYRIIKPVPCQFDSFKEGEIIRFVQAAHSIYDGQFGFFFKDEQGNDRRWDIKEDLDPVKEAKGKFEYKNDNRVAGS